MEVIYSGNRRLIDIESLQLLSQKGSEMNVYNDEELITDLKDYLDILNSNKEQKTKKLRKRKK